MNKKEIDRLTLTFLRKREDSLLDGVMESISRSSPATKYLEIGVFRGGTITKVLSASNPQPKVITLVDNFCEMYDGEAYDNFDHIHKICDKLEYENRREFIQENSHSALPRLIRSGNLYDLVLVDGDHTYYGQWLDIVQAWQLLDVNGLMVIDDIFNPTLPWVGYAFSQFYKEARKRGSCIMIETLNAQPDPGCGVLMKLKKEL